MHDDWHKDFTDDLEEFGEALHKRKRLNPIHFRAWWSANKDSRLSDHHNAAQYFTLLRSRNHSNLSGFRADLNQNIERRYSELVHDLGKLFVGGYSMENAIESRTQLLEIYDLLTGKNPEECEDATEAKDVLEGEKAQKAAEDIMAVPPGFVKIHDASEVKVEQKSSDNRADVRDKMRIRLAKPKRKRAPKNWDQIDEIIALLYQESPWMRGVIQWLWMQLKDSQEAGRGGQFSPVLLVGPPGCGKTYLAEKMAEYLGRAWKRLDGASMTASFSVGGSDFQWHSSHAGEPVRLIDSSETADPVLIFDEIEKTSANASGGDPKNALLPLLQQSTAATYSCPYLQSKIDLSGVGWVLLANSIEKIPAPLLDRVTVFHVGYPTGKDLENTIRRALSEYVVDDAVIQRVVREIEAGNMTLRAIDRLKTRLREVNRRPIVH